MPALSDIQKEWRIMTMLRKPCPSTTVIILALATCVLAGCPGSSSDDNFCDRGNPNCAEGLVCDPTTDGRGLCAQPVQITGFVQRLDDDSPVAGARVQAVDPSGAAVGTSATTGEDGS